MTSTAIDRLSARNLHDALSTAADWLALNRDAINAINVYPVPDGDTGTNMLATLRATLSGAAPESTDPADAYFSRLARAALLGARGNSGVILSQIIRGFAEGLDGQREVGAVELAAAFTSAARTAYAAVAQPVEGTMLTVIREAAQAGEAAASAGASLDAVLDAVAREAEATVERTPELLPRLREAGVVDAGGMGVAVLLQGLLHGCRGDALPAPLKVPLGSVDLEAVEHEGHGYCTEFVIAGKGLDRAELEGQLGALGGNSILVVGDADALRVHVHIPDPGPALSAGVRAGSLTSIKVDNMQAQHESWAAGHEAPAAALPEVGVVAVAQGAGIAAAFRDLGVRVVVDGGPTSNPSAGELLEAARRAGSRTVFVLPNDPNVIMAAQQAAEAAPDLLVVLPARSIAAGLAAAVAFTPGVESAELEAEMREAIEAAHAIEVTRAVRAATVDGIAVASGDAIALLDGRLVARADDEAAALRRALERLAEDGVRAEFVTAYVGADAGPEGDALAREAIAAVYPEAEVQTVDGGQPHYPLILAVE